MNLETCGIYSIISLIWSALLAQWYIVPIVHQTTGVRAPEQSKPFCCDLHVFWRVDFSAMRPQHCVCITSYAQLRTLIKYQHIPTLRCTCPGMLIHAHTCTYIQTPADTYIYCIYVHVCAWIACMCRYVSICRYCMYVKELPVCVGMSLCICIACMCRYCRYVQVCQYK